MPSLRLITITLALAISSISGAQANPVFRRQPKHDQVQIGIHNVNGKDAHAPGDRLNCGYLEKAGRDYPCARVPSAADAERYRTRDFATKTLEECAHSCFNTKCYSFNHLDGRCTLFNEEAFFIKDIMNDGPGSLYDVRCFNCS